MKQCHSRGTTKEGRDVGGHLNQSYDSLNLGLKLQILSIDDSSPLVNESMRTKIYPLAVYCSLKVVVSEGKMGDMSLEGNTGDWDYLGTTGHWTRHLYVVSHLH